MTVTVATSGFPRIGPRRELEFALERHWAGEITGADLCYSEFNDILPSIAAMDADVISIETARSQMKLFEGFATNDYANDIGPGVYDIHSARMPSEGQMVELMRLTQKHLSAAQLWVNPDCGLKTRDWAEVKPAIRAVVAAAQTLRAEATVAA